MNPWDSDSLRTASSEERLEVCLLALGEAVRLLALQARRWSEVMDTLDGTVKALAKIAAKLDALAIEQALLEMSTGDKDADELASSYATKRLAQ
ncbi:MAG: hypothetical protein JRJ26_05145 [Deltaproteobacteria bacterium]|nr:hypothetical protein [Deltaproteobacteria bacterium]